MTHASHVRVVPEPVLVALADIRTDGGTQIRVGELNQDLVDDLAVAYIEGPPPPPLVVFKDGASFWLADGFHRHAGAQKAQVVAKVECEVRIGDLRDAIIYACGANSLHGIRRTLADKRNAVRTLVDIDKQRVLEGHDPWKAADIARMAGVSHHLVDNIRPSSVRNSPGESDTDERQESAEPRGSEVEREPRVPSERDDADPREVEYDEPDVEPEHTFTGGSHDPGALSWRPVDGDSWSTPDDVIALARQVLGTIDLDPATNAPAQARIGAKAHYTKDDDGLSREWHGNVWLNPPYSQPLCSQFAAKLVEEYDAERVQQAILLVNNATDTKWLQPLLRRFPICLLEGRVRFVNEKNEPAMSPRDAQVIVYLGKDPARFVEVFRAMGAVLGPL